MIDLHIPFVLDVALSKAEAPDRVYRSAASDRLFKVKVQERPLPRGANPYSTMAIAVTASHCDASGKALEDARGPKGRAIARGLVATLTGLGDYEEQLEAARIRALAYAEQSASLAELRARLSA